jgi:formate dehydrogenase subunit delta
MKIERLIKMANDISNYFNAEPNRKDAIDGVKNHIAHSWEPRMRKALIEYNQQDGSELSELARLAVAELKG